MFLQITFKKRKQKCNDFEMNYWLKIHVMLSFIAVKEKNALENSPDFLDFCLKQLK